MCEVLYSDSYITLTSLYILINKYYFPLATSKTILFSDIEHVTMIDTDGVTHTWGVCPKYLNNWFHMDRNRKSKKKFIEISMKGRKIRPCITPDDPEKVFKIIWENHTPEGQKALAGSKGEINKQRQQK